MGNEATRIPHRADRAPYVVGIDIGGTFTDFVLTGPDQRLELHKCLTTPRNPAVGALGGLREMVAAAGIDVAEIGQVVHGTTLVTNTIIERKGADTALLVTRGFRDLLEMGYEQRYDIYDLFLQFPDPIVPRSRTVEIDERIDRDGRVLRAPDLAAVLAEVDLLVADGVESVAVSFLHAYRNPTHELAVTEAIRAKHPRLAVSSSHQVVPEIREYERTNTTACNAYVQPLMRRYLDDLQSSLHAEGFAGTLLLMQSSGGSATVETAARFPIRFLESGPAGGALVTAFLGASVGLPDLVAFDMGGTTAKAALIRDGRPEIAPMMEAGRVHRFKSGSGLPIKAPVVDMIEIGAGGGSIARVDAMGLMKVGPHSSGADPGPACYGQGGLEPTVTDACVLLGYFDPDYFLGGSMRLDLDAARSAFDGLAERLGLSRDEAVWGVHRMVCENMAQATRVHLIEKGEDPRRFAMAAFGGAGPAHAARVARIIGTKAMIVPRMSGVASALGFQVAPLSFEIARSLPTSIDDADWTEVQQAFDALERDALPMLESTGLTPEEVRRERWAEMRYVGQFHELDVSVPDGPIGPDTGRELTRRFAEAYTARYHSVLGDYVPMALNWRLRLVGPEPSPDLGAVATEGGASPLKGVRRAFFPEAGGWTDTPVYDRYALGREDRLVGPAIVEERESTTVLGVGDTLVVDTLGNLRIEVATP